MAIVLNSSASNALGWTLQKDWKLYHDFRDQCCKKAKTGPVHDLRVTLRRLISLLDLLEESGISTVSKKLLKHFKSELHCLRDLRDLQNQRKTLDERLKPSELTGFRKMINKKRKKEQKKAELFFNSGDFISTTLCIQTLAEKLFSEPGAPLFETRIQERLKKVLSQRFEHFEHSASRAKQDAPLSFHQARIQFKKFRYTWEALETIFPKRGTAEADLKSLQKLLGKVQDANVLTQLLVEYCTNSGKVPPEPKVLELFRNTEKEYEQMTLEFLSCRQAMLKSIRSYFVHTKKQAD